MLRRPLPLAIVVFLVAEALFLIGLTVPHQFVFDEVHYVPAARALLTLDGTLRMAAGMTLRSSPSVIRLEPGMRITGETSGFTAIVDWAEAVQGNTTASTLYLRDIVGTPVAGETFTGPAIPQPFSSTGDTFDPDIHDHDGPEWNPVVTPTGTILSFTAAMPRIAPFVSGIHGADAPTVTPTVALSAGSVIEISRADLLEPGTHYLTGEGVTVTNNGAVLPAGVSVTGGRLVLTV